MSAPLVSVVLPTYRRAQIIGRALRSVLKQTMSDLEVIVVDDASGDETERVVNELKDPRVRFVPRPVNGGAAAARNTGLQMARGKYVAFQDSDDEWLAEKLSRQVSRLESLPAEVALTQGAVLRFDKLGAEYLLSDLPEESAILRLNMTTFTQGWLARREALLSVGAFEERLPMWEDWEYLIRISERYGIDLDPRPMAMVYDTPGSLTSLDAQRAAAFRVILEKHAARMQRHPRILAQNFYTLARLELINDRVADCYRALFRSLRLNPLQPRGWALLLAAAFGSRLVNFVARRRRRWRRSGA